MGNHIKDYTHIFHGGWPTVPRAGRADPKPWGIEWAFWPNLTNFGLYVGPFGFGLKNGPMVPVTDVDVLQTHLPPQRLVPNKRILSSEIPTIFLFTCCEGPEKKYSPFFFYRWWGDLLPPWTSRPWGEHPPSTFSFNHIP